MQETIFWESKTIIRDLKEEIKVLNGEVECQCFNFIDNVYKDVGMSKLFNFLFYIGV